MTVVPAAVLSATTAPAEAVITGTVLSGTPSPMWQTNNEVDALAAGGGVIYAGGTFTQVRPPGTDAGSSQEVARTYLAAFNGSSGALVTGFNVTLNGRVRALAVSPDGSRLYLAGNFTSVNGTTRNRIAAVNLPSGTLVTSFNPNANRTVMAVDASSTTVYLGGDFSRVGSTTVTNLASVSAATGAVNTAFVPSLLPPPPSANTTPSPRVNTIEVAPDGSRVLVGGSFQTVNDVLTGGVVSLDPDDASLEQWDASLSQPINTNCLGRTTKIIAVGDTAYVTAEGDPAGCYEGTYSARISDGRMNWNTACLGASQGIAVLDGVLYKGSHQHDCAFTEGGVYGGFVGGTSRDTFIHRYLVGQDVRDGSFIHWTPNTNAAGTTSVGPHVMVSDGTQVVVGGDFNRVNGGAQQGLTRFRPGGNTYTPDIPGRSFNGDPWPNTEPKIVMSLPITVQPTAANTLTVEIPAVQDSDSGTLTYRVYRDNGPTPVATLQSESYPWTRPVMRFDDTGLAPGSTHSYRVTASDGTFTSAQSSAVSGTVASGAPPTYADLTPTLNPLLWWRLDDTGVTASDSSAAGTTPGTFEGGVTQNQPGQLAGNAAVGLDGTTGYVASTSMISAPGTFSESAWFRTTSIRGGVIVAQTDQQIGAGGTVDRTITMDNNGALVFGVGRITVRNQGPTWNDGRWHHVVGTYDGNGTANLYVDGWSQGTTISTRLPAPMDTSYVRAGYVDMTGMQLVFGRNFYNLHWPFDDHFGGSIDEVAVFDTVLSPEQVAALFASGVAGESTAPPPPAPPTATFTSSVSDLSVQVDAAGSTGSIQTYAWDFGDGTTSSGSSPSASHAYAATGTYTVTLTVTDANAQTAQASRQVSVTAPPPPPPGPTVDTVAVENGQSWRWRYEGSAPPADWNAVGFADSGWSLGNALFGWGTAVSTSLDIYPSTTDRPRAAQFRRSFTVDDVSQVVGLRLTTVANDGVVVYVNGTEVGRSNMPSGPITYLSWASSARNVTTANNDPVVIDVPRALLVDGVNVISAQTHVNYRNTRDVSFDLRAVLTESS